MTISIRSETTGTGAGNGSNQVSISKPSSVSNGDYLVVVMGSGDDLPNIAPPADWTTGDINASSTGNDRQIMIAYKKITNAAGEPTSYTFTLGSGDNGAWWIGSLSGVDQDTPQDETMSGNAVTLSNDLTPDAPSITTANPDSFVLAGWCTNYFNDATMPGGSWANRAQNIGTSPCNLCVVSQTFASSGSTGSVAITSVTTGMETSCGQWAFRAAVTGITVSPTAIASAAAKVDPTIILGSISYAPAIASSVSTVINPTVELAFPSVAVEPGVVSAVSQALDPTYVAGSLSVSPEPAMSVAASIAPDISLGSIALELSSAIISCSLVLPDVALGSLSFDNLLVSAGASGVDPTVDLSSLDEAYVSWIEFIAPLAVGKINLINQPAISKTSALISDAVCGSILITDLIASAGAYTIDPTVEQASISIDSIIASAVATIENPETVCGSLSFEILSIAGTAALIGNTEQSSISLDMSGDSAASTAIAFVESILQSGISIQPELANISTVATVQDIIQSSISIGDILATASALAVDPVCLISLLEITPSPASSGTYASATVLTSGIDITPTAVTISALASDPNVIEMWLPYTPDCAVSSCVSNIDTVIMGYVVIVDAIAIAGTDAIIFDAISGSLQIAPDPAQALINTEIPGVILGAITVESIAISSTSVVQPAIEYGSVVIQNIISSAVAVGIDPVYTIFITWHVVKQHDVNIIRVVEASIER